MSGIGSQCMYATSHSYQSSLSSQASFRTDEPQIIYRNTSSSPDDELVTPCQHQRTFFHHDDSSAIDHLSTTSDFTWKTTNPPQVASSGGNKKTQYHKTKLCPWHRDGKCFMGASCNYAHSRDELRPKPDLSKTKLCPELVKGRRCNRAGCRFAHDFVELRATSAFFKTRICKFWQRGHCPAGEECRHAHGREDLRASAVPAQGAAKIPPMDYGEHLWTAYNDAIAPCSKPSFQSASTSSPSPNWSSGVDDMAALMLLRNWINQEVERSDLTPDRHVDERAFLPMEVVRGLNTPANRQLWAASGEGTSPSSPSPTIFAAAVKTLITSQQNKMTDTSSDATPTRLLLKTLGTTFG